MSSWLSGGGDFYSSRRNGVGSTAISLNPLQYRSQLGGILLDQSFSTVPPRKDMFLKRSLGEFQRHPHQYQQKGVEFFLRSVKQRSSPQQRSPISLISPVEFPASISPEKSSAMTFAPYLSERNGNYSLLQQKFQPATPAISLNSHTNASFHNATLSGLTYSDFIPNRVGIHQSELDSEKKMRNRLQELEKQLLNDDDDEKGEGEAVSDITSCEWSETIHSLLNLTQKPLSPCSTNSSSSSSSSSSTSPSSSSIGSSIQSLSDAAALISEGKTDFATASLTRLKQISNTQGDSEQRLTAYMISSLQSRLKNPIENPSNLTELLTSEHLSAIQMLYENSPCFKLGFMAANLAIVEAAREQPTKNVHVIDFDIGQGNQYIILIHALSELNLCNSSPTIFKITTINDPSSQNEEELRKIGENLSKLAERVGVRFNLNVVSSEISDLTPESFECDSDEVLAVNFVFRLSKMADESVSTENPRDSLLRLVKSLAPRVVTLVEQEMNTNTAPFVTRVTESSSYYRALFDSLDATMARDSVDRVRVEECLARKVTNAVACEGRERVERCEVFGKWRARMGMAGFKPRPLSQHVTDSLRARLTTGFTIKEEAGGVCFGWMDRVLTVASTWC